MNLYTRMNACIHIYACIKICVHIHTYIHTYIHNDFSLPVIHIRTVCIHAFIHLMPHRYGSKVVTAVNATTEHSSKEKHICKEANCTVRLGACTYIDTHTHTMHTHLKFRTLT